MNGNQIVNVYDAAGRKLRTTSYALTEPLATPATRVLQLAYIVGNVKETGECIVVYQKKDIKR